MALTIVGAGVFLALSVRVDALVDASTYALAVGVVGALNVGGGAWQVDGRARRIQLTESARELRVSAMATWDGLADRYNAQELYETRALETAVRLAAATPGERLVDLATGTGLLLRCLAERPIGPLHAVGVDRSARMLARGSVRCPPVGRRCSPTPVPWRCPTGGRMS